MADFRESYKRANQKFTAPESLKDKALENLNERKKTPYKKMALAAVALALCVSIAAVTLVQKNSVPLTGHSTEGNNVTQKATLPVLGAEAKALAKVAGVPQKDQYEAGERADIPNGLSKAYKDFSVKSGKIILSAKPGENQLYSPLSLYNVLGMLSASSTGKSKSEILAAMNLSSADDLDKLVSAFMFKSESGLCDIKNSIWLNENVSYNQSTLDKLAKKYRTEVYKMNFASENAPKEVSGWISKNTRGLLKYEPEFTPNDVAKFVNTVYFKSEWQSEFNKDFNTVEPFKKSNGEKINCEYMHKKDFDCYYETDEAVFSAVNLKNGYQMVFALPKGNRTPSDLIKNEKALRTLINWINVTPTGYCEVEWSVPKFRVNGDYELEEPLKALGIREAFKPTADFSPLSTDVGPMFISKALQQSTLSIDEKGCEAAAFTIIDLYGAGIPEKIIKMTLDRPFLFSVVGTNGPLFVGAVEEPIAK